MLDDPGLYRRRPQSRPSTLLVVGFGPFQHYDRNPSGEIARAVDGGTLGGVQVRGQAIPTTWRGSWQAICAQVESHRPDGLLCLGMSPHPFIRLEARARNLVFPEVDAAGEFVPPEGHAPIEPDAQDTLATTLPLEHLAAQLEQRWQAAAAQGYQAVRSQYWYDSGLFICNYVFFKMMYHLSARLEFAGLIHIPRLPIGLEAARPSEAEVLASGEFLVAVLAHSLCSRSA
jgi:pyroglutamyl-peptidase